MNRPQLHPFSGNRALAARWRVLLMMNLGVLEAVTAVGKSVRRSRKARLRHPLNSTKLAGTF